MHVPIFILKMGKQTAATVTLPRASSRQLCDRRMKAGASAISVLSVILSSRESSFFL